MTWTPVPPAAARCARTRTCSTPGSRSWLVPFSSLGWPERTHDLARFYPGHTLVSGARDPLLLGLADDHGGLHFMGEVAVSPTSICTAPCATRSIARCPSRSATASIRSRWWSATAPTRCATRSCPGMAVGTDVILDPADLEASFAPGAQLRQQAVECRPVHPVQSRRADCARSPARIGRGAPGRADRSPTAGSSPGATRPCAKPPTRTSGSASTRRRRRCTASSGATWPTGTSSRSSPGSTAISPAATSLGRW